MNHYFRQKCKQTLQEEELDLPKQNFGPSVMCTNCGNFWDKVAPIIKILPAKPLSKSVKKLSKKAKLDYLSKFQTTLLKKCLNNQKNQLTLKCKICAKITKVAFNKPKVLKPKKVKNLKSNTPMSNKKKKKHKDKTAGLNISGIASPKNISLTQNLTQPQEIVSKIDVRKKHVQKESTPTQKLKKINMKRLKNALEDSSSEKKKKNNLSEWLNFLT